MTTNLKTVTTENLHGLIKDTEEALAELKQELKRREELAQHRELANIDSHIRSAELSVKSLRDFVAYLLADLRSDK